MWMVAPQVVRAVSVGSPPHVVVRVDEWLVVGARRVGRAVAWLVVVAPRVGRAVPRCPIG